MSNASSPSPGFQKHRGQTQRAGARKEHGPARHARSSCTRTGKLTTSPPRPPVRLRGPPTALAAPARLRASALDQLRLRPQSLAFVQQDPMACGSSTVALPFPRVCLTAPKQLYSVPASISKISLKSVLLRVELYWSLPFPLLASSDCGSQLESSLGFFRKKLY